MDDIFEKYEEILRNYNIIVVFKVLIFILDNINDIEFNKIEEDELDCCIFVFESKNGKENVVFIKMLVKFDVCCLFVIDIEKEDGVIEMIVSVWFLYFKDYLNDKEIFNYDVSILFIIVFEFKNDDELKGRDIKVEKDDLKMVLDMVIGGDIKFDIIYIF